MTELKPRPCAHCDGNDLSIETYALGGNEYIFEIECLWCKTTWRTVLSFGEGDTAGIKKWNRRASPWVRVEDGLPESDDFMAVMDGTETWKRAFYYEGDWWNEDEMPVEDVTHWMPIPKLTEEGF